MSSLRALICLFTAGFFAIPLLLSADAHAQSAAAAFDADVALRRSQATIGTLPGNHALTTADGRRTGLAQYRGKPLVLQFVYTGCFQVCPTTTRVLAGAVKEAQRALGADSFRILTLGFNLPFDSPLAMKDYARKHQVMLSNWDFASPDADALKALTAELGFSYAPTPNGFDHILQITILDADGRIYRQVYGDAFDLPLLIEPLKALLTGNPSPAPKLTEWIERVRLLCTVYDPRAGRYRLNYAILIEILIGASIIVFGIYSLAAEWRRQRRRSAGA